MTSALVQNIFFIASLSYVITGQEFCRIGSYPDRPLLIIVGLYHDMLKEDLQVNYFNSFGVLSAVDVPTASGFHNMITRIYNIRLSNWVNKPGYNWLI